MLMDEDWIKVVEEKILILESGSAGESWNRYSPDCLLNFSGFTCYHPVNLDFLAINLDEHDVKSKLGLIYCFALNCCLPNQSSTEKAEKISVFLNSGAPLFAFLKTHQENKADSKKISRIIGKRIGFSLESRINFWPSFIRNVFIEIDIAVFRISQSSGDEIIEIRNKVISCYITTIMQSVDKLFFSESLLPLIKESAGKFIIENKKKWKNIGDFKELTQEKMSELSCELKLNNSLARLNYVTKWAYNKSINIIEKESDEMIIIQIDIISFFINNYKRVIYFTSFVRIDELIEILQKLVKNYILNNILDFKDELSDLPKFGREQKLEIVEYFKLAIHNFKGLKDIYFPDYFITISSLTKILPDTTLPELLSIDSIQRKGRKNTIIEQ